MTRKRDIPNTPDPVWAEFAARHPGHPHLSTDPLVALPADALAALARVRGLFGKADLVFEKRLSACVIRGFLHRRPMSALPGWGGAASAPGKTVEGAFRTSGYKGDFTGRGIGPEPASNVPLPAFITQARYDVLSDRGITKPVADELAGRSAETDDQLRQRAEAFAGWLVVEPRYRSELHALRRAWADLARGWGGIPHPGEYTAGHPGGDGARAVGEFCRRWCLERLWDWDWPEPRPPDLGVGRYRLDPDEGVTLSLPWAMLRGKQVDYHEVIRNLRRELCPAHLRGWVIGAGPGRHRKQGEIRHRTAFALYRTLVLALHRRYPASSAGLVGEVDEALGDVLGTGAEAVKRVRLALLRALAAPPSPGEPDPR